jgi:hypothetical protein
MIYVNSKGAQRDTDDKRRECTLADYFAKFEVLFLQPVLLLSRLS